MPAEWTGDVVKELHLKKITYQELADEIGVTKAYISMILNSKVPERQMRERIPEAINRIWARRVAS